MRRFNPVLALSAFAVLLASCDSGRLLDPSLSEASLARSGGDPVAPSNLVAAALSTTEIRIDWQDNSTNEVMFEIYRSTPDTSGPYTSWATADANRTGFIDARLDAPLAEGTQYCYRVRSVVVKGARTTYSAFSNTACATTPVTPPPPPPPVPAAPSEMRPMPLASTEVRLNWADNSSNEDGFRIDRSTDFGSTWAVAGTVPAGFSTFSEAGRTAEVQVCYRVVAFNVGGEAVSATACTTPPAAPTNLTGTPIDSTGYDLSWSDNSAVEDSYEVWAYVYYPSYCSGDVCEAGYSEGEELLATLPANSTAYRCETCAGAASVWVKASKDGGHSSSAGWDPNQ